MILPSFLVLSSQQSKIQSKTMRTEKRQPLYPLPLAPTKPSRSRCRRIVLRRFLGAQQGSVNHDFGIGWRFVRIEIPVNS